MASEAGDQSADGGNKEEPNIVRQEFSYGTQDHTWQGAGLSELRVAAEKEH